MKKSIFITIIIAAGLIMGFFVFSEIQEGEESLRQEAETETRKESPSFEKQKQEQEQEKKEENLPMAIETLRSREYPGGDFAIKETLPNGSNYEQYVASYKSEGLKIYGLLTVPVAEKPNGGFPAVVFVHGYIPPKQYSTIESYPTYQAALARAGFVSFKPDLRGHGQSEGEPESAHFSEKYVIDTLNAIAYLENYDEVNPKKILYWGHSNGGEIGLRAAVISEKIQAYSFWAGVVGSYQDELETHNPEISFLQGTNSLVEKHGLPSQNPAFWSRIDAHSHLENISAPIQLQHATGDQSVPVELSRSLRDALEKQGKEVEYIEYQGDDHNISQNSGVAWQRTIEFFNENLE